MCAVSIVGLGFLSISGSRYVDQAEALDFSQWWVFGTWVVSLLFLHALLILTRSRVDPVLVGLGLSLVGIGILAQYRMSVFSGSLDESGKPSLSALSYPIGFFMMVASHQAFRSGRFQGLRKSWVLWMIGSLAVVAFVLVTGRRFRGALMAVGNLTPTEILKLFVPLTVAGFLCFEEALTGKKAVKKLTSSNRSTWMWIVLSLALGCVLVGLLIQRDLGMILILTISIGFQLFAGQGSWWILPLMGVGMMGAVGVVQQFFPHALARFDVWIDPFVEPTRGGWQILQSFSGMYAGGLWGAGWGQGDPERIPIAKSDFIYSVIGEEMGFLGCSLLLLFFGIFVSRAYRIAEAAETRFARLLGSGLVSVVAVQIIINVAGVVKVLPMTGVPLVFVSHGGTSLVTSLTILGFLMALNDSPQMASAARKNVSSKRNRAGKA